MDSIPELAAKLDADRREQAEAMTFGQRLLAGADLFDLCMMMLRAGIQMQHPDADEQKVEELVLKRLHDARRNEARE